MVRTNFILPRLILIYNIIYLIVEGALGLYSLYASLVVVIDADSKRWGSGLIWASALFLGYGLSILFLTILEANTSARDPVCGILKIFLSLSLLYGFQDRLYFFESKRYMLTMSFILVVVAIFSFAKIYIFLRTSIHSNLRWNVHKKIFLFVPFLFIPLWFSLTCNLLNWIGVDINTKFAKVTGPTGKGGHGLTAAFDSDPKTIWIPVDQKKRSFLFKIDFPCSQRIHLSGFSINFNAAPNRPTRKEKLRGQIELDQEKSIRFSLENNENSYTFLYPNMFAKSVMLQLETSNFPNYEIKEIRFMKRTNRWPQDHDVNSDIDFSFCYAEGAEFDIPTVTEY